MHAKHIPARRAAWLLAALILFVAGMRPTSAAEVRLKNGNIIKGEIVIETDSIVIVDIGGGQITLQKENIKEILRKDRFGSATETPDKPSRDKKSADAEDAAGKGPTRKGRAEKESGKDEAKEKRDAERKAKAEAARKAKEEAEKEENTWGLKSLDLEENQEAIKAYTPGNPAKYEWKALADALPAIKEGAKPALLYVYALEVAKPDEPKAGNEKGDEPKPGKEKADDKKTDKKKADDRKTDDKKAEAKRTDAQKLNDQKSAYYYEQKIFPNPKLESLKLDEVFLLVKANSLEENTVEELAGAYREIAGKTGVAVLNKDLSIARGGALLGRLPKAEQFVTFIDDAQAVHLASSYVPGSTEAFAWVTYEQGVEQMKTEKKPGLLYLYCGAPKADKDRLLIYQIERAFSDERIAKIKDQIVPMKIDSSKDLAAYSLLSGKLDNRTMVILWTFDKATADAAEDGKKTSTRKSERTWGARPSAEDLEKELGELIKQNELLKYEPGCDTTFAWMELAAGLAKLKGGELPGLLYAFSKDDVEGAYQWEKEVFPDPDFKDVAGEFVMIKCDIKDAEKVEELKLKPQRKPESVVLLLGPDLGMLMSVSSKTKVDKFRGALNRAETMLKKEREKAKAKEE